MNNNHTKQSTGAKECSLAQKTLSGGVTRGFLARILAACLLLCICFTANAQISGPSSVCQGYHITLTNPTSGGTWSSSNTAIATIDAMGEVRGNSYGTAIISYDYTTGIDTWSVIVTPPPPPGPITGAGNLCNGQTLTLADTTPGGAWSSVNPLVATVDGSGVVTAVGPGTTSIEYSIYTSCGLSSASALINVGEHNFWQWAKSFGSSGNYEWAGGSGYHTSTVATDDNGNSYVTGEFTGTVTFGSFTVTPIADPTAFTAKFDANGQCLWVRKFGGNLGGTAGLNEGQGISIDASGNCYVGGTFAATDGATITFGSSTLTGTNRAEVFLAKYDANGNELWAVQPSPLSYYPTALFRSLKTDAYGNSYMTGETRRTGVSFGSLPPLSSDGTYVVKYDASGDAVWATIISTGTVSPFCITVDGSGNSILAGTVQNTATFSTTSGSVTTTAIGLTDVFLAKVNSTGGLEWVQRYGGTSTTYPHDAEAYGKAVATDMYGNIYLTGNFSYLTSFGSIDLTSGSIPYYYTAFVGKFDQSGNPIWVKQSTGDYDTYGKAIMVSNDGEALYVAGQFRDHVTLGSVPMIPVSSGTAFVAKYNGYDGTCYWAQFPTSGGTTSLQGIGKDNQGNIYVAGSVYGATTFDCFTTTDYGGYDIFIGKLGARCVDATPNGSNTVCVGATTTLSNSITGGTFVSSNPSIATVSSTGLVTGVSAGTTVISYILSTGCTSAVGTNTISVYPIASISGSSSVCNGSSATLSPSISGGNWSSSHYLTASVGSSSGVVAGVAFGTVTITYTFGGGCNATHQMTINPFPPSAITGNLNLCIGDVTLLSTTTTGGTWSSTNTAVATIDGTGNVTAVGVGASLVMYSISTSCGTASATAMVAVGQRNSWEWVQSAGSTNSDGYGNLNSSPIVADASGNVYITGTFQGTATFGSSSISSAGFGGGDAVFTAKYNSAGSCLWVKTFNSSASRSLAGSIDIDASGNSYVVGTLSLYPGTPFTFGSSTISETGYYIPFIVKYDANGNELWAKAASGAISSAELRLVKTDRATGDCYALGFVQDTNVVFGSLAPLPHRGTVVVKYDGSGNALWATNIGTYSAYGWSLAIDASGNTFVAGDIASVADTFNTTAGVVIHSNAQPSGHSSFVAKLDASGDMNWVKFFDGVPNPVTDILISFAKGIGVDNSGNIYVAGLFNDNITIGSSTLRTIGAYNTYSGYLAKLDGSGNTVWAKQSHQGFGSTIWMTSILLNAAGEPLVSGYFQGDVSLGSVPLSTSSVYQKNAFVAQFDASGNCLWGKVTNGSASAESKGIALDGIENIYLLGGYGNTLNFDCETINTFGNIDYFIAKLGPACVASPTGTNTVCVGSTISLIDTTVGGTWSSSDVTVATVGSTGIVSGVAAGAVTISYSIPGCTSGTVGTIVVTVTACSGITGSSSVCAGLSTTLSHPTYGGAWTSSNTAVATVDGSGNVMSVSAGTATITYTTMSGIATLNMTVNPAPSAISGSAGVCIGATATYTNGVSGGVWSSSNTAIATIGSASGTLTAISGGTTTLSYVLGSGCSTFVTVTVNPFPPSPITGNLNLCTGDVVTLSSTPAGGTWSSSNSAVATISGGGVVTVTGSGSSLIMYSISTPCGVASTSAMLNVNQANKWEWAYSAGATGQSLMDFVGNSSPMATDASGNTYVTGRFTGTTDFGSFTVSSGTSYQSAAFVAKYNSAGVCQWVKTLSGASPSFPYNNAGRNIGVDASGNCYVAGYLSEAAGATVAFGSDVLTGNGANQFYLVKYDANGNEIWARQPTMGTSGSDGLQSLATDASGNCFLAGYTTYDNITFGSTSTLSPGSFVAKYDASGNAIWATRLGAGYLTIPYAVTSDASGACYVTGNKEGTQVFATTSPTTLSAIGDRDVFVGKIDASGVFQWVRQFGFSGTSLSVYRRDAYGKTIKADGSGNIFVAGDFYGGLTVGSTTYTLPATVATGVFITKLDGSGNPIWVKSNNGSGQMIFGNAMTLSATGDPVLTGVSVGPNNFGPATGPQMTGDNNVYVAKFSSTTGDCNWVRSSVVPDYYGNAEVYGIGTDASDNIYIGGHTRNSTATFGCATTANTSSLAVYLAKLGPGCGTITPAGATPVCMGSSTTLTDVTTGGTWYTSSPAVAVDMTTGDITTLSPGTATVSYTTRSGCIRTTTIAVNPLPAAITGSLSICEGSLQTLSSATPGGEWTSGDYDVVIVGSGTGIVTGIGPGVTDIIYTITGTGCARSVTVTVNAAAPNSGGGSVCAGQSLALINTITGGAWTSGNTAIATVGSTTGIVTGVAGGVANITYTNPSGCRSVSTVTVVALSPISGPGTVCQSQSVTLTNAAPGGTWTSTDGSVATINTLTGVVNGIAPGVVTISYTISGLGCSATHTLSVNPFAPISGPTSVCLGQTVTLSNAATGGVWSSNNSAIASIGSVSGIATGVAGGIATISYNLGSCRATQLLTVNTISTISGPASVCQGQTITLTNAGTGLWTSNDDAMATVGSTSGVITGVTAGVAIITYTLPTGCFATKTLTINALAPIAGPTSVCVGSTITLTDAVGGGTWLSGNTTRATIGSTSGIVTGIATGTLPISYTVGGCRAITTFTVNTVSAITGAASVCQGQTTTLTAVAGGSWSSSDNTIATIGSTTGVVSGVNTGIVTLSYTMATGCYTTKTMTVNALAPIIGSSSVCLGQTTTLTNTLSGGIWTSGNTTRATVGSVSGIVTGIAAGSAPISYTIGGCRDIVNITVNTLSAITGTASVCQGLTTTLTSVGAGLWNSANTGIATVGSTSGVVTGVNAGTTVISFTLATGCTAVRTVTVNPLSPISGLSSVCIGQTITLTNATPGGLWTSGTPARATVGSVNGVVTGISSGITLVSYTIGSCRATQAVTVSSLGAITGPNRVCENQNINLTNIGGGGIWTSSNTAIGTVVSNTGAVTGVTAGTFIISYTIGTSCTATYPVTVNPLAVITGPAFVCVGQSVALSDATPGGSWTSGNTNIAIIGSGTGVATGVLLGGNVNISYTVTNTGCRTTRQLQVYRLSVIAGPTSVCEGQTITVTDAEGGGTWSSSNPGVAAIGSTNGVINGVTAGTAVISYILPTTCTATSVITVNPLSPITGANSVCMSTPTTLSNATPGGLWTSTNPTIARVGSTTGLVTGLNTGITNITYTIAATGCRLVVPMTVNPCRYANDNAELNTGTFDVRIFPNPNKGSFNLNGYLGSSKTEEVTVEIVNMLGQVVYTNKYTVADGRINEQIQLNSSLANGMYLLNFNAENEKRVFHFVLQQ